MSLGLSIVLFLLVFYYPTINRYITQVTPTPTITEGSKIGEYHTVTRVIDGDTIELDNKQIVRYIGMDTPELHHPKKPVQCYGEEAKRINETLVLHKTVRLVKDISETDRYGRLLRYVYVDQPMSTQSALFVNGYLVQEGYARVATFPPDVAQVAYFQSLQNEARVQGKGLWSACE